MIDFPPRIVVGFAVRSDAENVAAAFNGADVSASVIHGDLTARTRRRILAAYAFAGSAAAAGTVAAEAFSAAMAQTYVTTPDLGLTGMAEEAIARAEAYREASGMLADAAALPMQSLAGAEGRRRRGQNGR